MIKTIAIYLKKILLPKDLKLKLICSPFVSHPSFKAFTIKHVTVGI